MSFGDKYGCFSYLICSYVAIKDFNERQRIQTFCVGFVSRLSRSPEKTTPKFSYIRDAPLSWITLCIYCTNTKKLPVKIQHQLTASTIKHAKRINLSIQVRGKRVMDVIRFFEKAAYLPMFSNYRVVALFWSFLKPCVFLCSDKVDTQKLLWRAFSLSYLSSSYKNHTVCSF